MSLSAERLYNLLPAIYRVRDEQQGKPLLALVSLIAREIEAIEENIDQLYDDQFIETCDAWVPPYIGDLIGYRPLHYGVATKAIRSARAEVANTIGYRRRKGTAAMLEQLARDVTDWPARAVEFFEQLATTQYMNHIRLHAQATADLRSVDRLRRLDGPFNTVAHTAEMRRPEGGSGRYNIPNVGIFLWRLLALPLSNVPLTPDPGDPTGKRFRFNPLGADQPLFRKPVTETLISHIAEPINVPEPIDLRAMAAAVKMAVGHPEVADDYGPGESIVLARPDANPAKPPTPIDVASICVCDLRDVAGGWAHETTVDPDTIAIDPRLGRVVLGGNVTGPIVATFHSGFSREIGGGEYERTPSGSDLPTQRTASNAEALQPHLTALAGGGRLMIGDSLTYPGTLTFTVNDTPAGARATEVVVTARDGARPLIASSGPMLLDIGKGSRLVLEGLVISGGELQMVAAGDDQPRELVLRHCTLVPGLSLNTDGTGASPGAPSLTIAHPFADVTLEHCIVGALQIDTDAKATITDCIVDAGSPEAVAFEGRVAGNPGAELTIVDSTVIGKMHVRLMTLASNTIFFARVASGDLTWKAPLWVERKQDGCVRFCFVPTGSLVPRRFRCVPDDAHPDALPHFTSLRYGDPGYAQLRRATDRSIREGAADESEIGVMRTLFQPQRETNLRIRLDEYLRFGLHAGIFYVT